MEASTEQIVLNAARKVFTQKGFDGTRMQDIADEAGINKSLLHYYFRSKDNLFEAIFKDALGTLLQPMASILVSDSTLFEKITHFTDTYIDILLKNPDIAGFVLHELKMNPHRLLGTLAKSGIDLSIIGNQLQKEAKAGNIRPVETNHFIANLVSMCIFPFIARPVFMGLLGMGGGKYDQFIEERKMIVSKTVIQSITLQR